MYKQKDRPIVVGIANNAEDREAIFKLRYQIYHEEMGKPIEADEKSQMIYDEYDEDGYLFFAKVGTQIVGTIRVHIGTATDLPDPIRDFFLLSKFQKCSPGLPTLSYTSRLMVAPEFRGSWVLHHLFAELYRFGVERGVLFNFCYCDPQLVSLYERVGYRKYIHQVNHPELMDKVPLVLVVDDIHYLRKIHSPFYFIARKSGVLHNRKSEEWFHHSFLAIDSQHC